MPRSPVGSRGGLCRTCSWTDKPKVRGLRFDSGNLEQVRIMDAEDDDQGGGGEWAIPSPGLGPLGRLCGTSSWRAELGIYGTVL